MALSGWVSGQTEPWRARVRVAALDPFRRASALREQLPDAVRVLDAFHVVELGFDVVDQVRRRVNKRPPDTAAARMIALRHPAAAAPRTRPAHRSLMGADAHWARPRRR
jgi:transposase